MAISQDDGENHHRLDLCVRCDAEHMPHGLFQPLMSRTHFPDEESEAQDPEVTYSSSCSFKCLSLYLNSFNPYSIFTWSFIFLNFGAQTPLGHSDFLRKVKVSGWLFCFSSQSEEPKCVPEPDLFVGYPLHSVFPD